MEIGIAAGGFIKQAIIEESLKCEWDSTQTKAFDVQILNSQHFQAVTGFLPPPSCVTAQTCADYGYPFYSMSEEPTVVAGNFTSVKSIAQLEGKLEPHVVPPTVTIGSIPAVKEGIQGVDGADVENGPAGVPRASRVEVNFFNPDGPASKFRSVAELKKWVKKPDKPLF